MCVYSDDWSQLSSTYDRQRRARLLQMCISNVDFTSLAFDDIWRSHIKLWLSQSCRFKSRKYHMVLTSVTSTPMTQSSCATPGSHNIRYTRWFVISAQQYVYSVDSYTTCIWMHCIYQCFFNMVQVATHSLLYSRWHDLEFERGIFFLLYAYLHKRGWSMFPFFRSDDLDGRRGQSAPSFIELFTNLQRLARTLIWFSLAKHISGILYYVHYLNSAESRLEIPCMLFLNAYPLLLRLCITSPTVEMSSCKLIVAAALVCTFILPLHSEFHELSSFGSLSNHNYYSRPVPTATLLWHVAFLFCTAPNYPQSHTTTHKNGTNVLSPSPHRRSCVRRR